MHALISLPYGGILHNYGSRDLSHRPIIIPMFGSNMSQLMDIAAASGGVWFVK